MTTAHAKAAFDEAEEVFPERPKALVREVEPAEPFPVDALGSILGDAATGIEDRVQAPMALCAQSVLAAATFAVQSHVDVRLPTGQGRPASAFFVSIAASGERKTSVDHEALWAIRKHEQALRERYEEELPSYQNEKAAWDRQREQILRDKKNGTKALKKAALDELGPAPVPPLEPMLVCPEPTYEGLCRYLALGQPSVGIFSAEGGAFIGGHGMSAEAKLRTAAGLSSLWDGETIRRVRAGDGAIVLPGKRLTLHLMAQPNVAATLLSDPLVGREECAVRRQPGLGC